MSVLASFTNLGGPDLIIILLIILVLFGAKKLPELARGLGQAMREFQKAKDEFGNELHKADQANTAAAKPNAQPAQSTVPRIEETSSGGTPQTDAGQTTTPSGNVGQA
jgi:sec-independent protein translocase protein TatA